MSDFWQYLSEEADKSARETKRFYAGFKGFIAAIYFAFVFFTAFKFNAGGLTVALAAVAGADVLVTAAVIIIPLFAYKLSGKGYRRAELAIAFLGLLKTVLRIADVTLLLILSAKTLDSADKPSSLKIVVMIFAVLTALIVYGVEFIALIIKYVKYRATKSIVQVADAIDNGRLEDSGGGFYGGSPKDGVSRGYNDGDEEFHQR